MADITNWSELFFLLKIDKASEFSTQHSRQPPPINWNWWMMESICHPGTTWFWKVLPALEFSDTLVLILVSIWILTLGVNILHVPVFFQLYKLPGDNELSLSHPIPFDSYSQSRFLHLYFKGNFPSMVNSHPHVEVIYCCATNHTKT